MLHRSVVRCYFLQVVLLLVFPSLAFADDATVPTPLRRAHAHNDYEHTRPLFEALDEGFCSVEADVFLVDGQLLVAHNRQDCQPTKTLESLYLRPLQERVKAHGGVYPGVTDFSLWIDIKVDMGMVKAGNGTAESEARATCQSIEKLLEKYSSMLTTFSDRGTKTNAITVILTGSHPRVPTTQSTNSLVSLDSHISDRIAAHERPFTFACSENWTHFFDWHGNGVMPAIEKEKLRGLMAKAHREGRRVRFWATPEKTAIWKELRDADVDWIGTDHLKELAEFLKTNDKDVFGVK